MNEKMYKLVFAYESRIDPSGVAGAVTAVPDDNPATGSFDVMEISRSETGRVLAKIWVPGAESICTGDAAHLVWILTEALDRLSD